MAGTSCHALSVLPRKMIDIRSRLQNPILPLIPKMRKRGRQRASS